MQEGNAVVQWPTAPETIRFEPGQIHLWAVALNEFANQAPKLSVLLSTAEHSRAEKFKFIEDRNRYVIRHGLFRLILGRYLEQLPSTIEFYTGAHGKPELRRDTLETPLFFNTSHSSDIAVLAIASDCPVGVDIERVQETSDIEEIARRFFLPTEIRALENLPQGSRLQAFYNCWTRKEAVLKATGEGISENLAKLEVTLVPEEEPEVLSFRGDHSERNRWKLHPFSPAPAYTGCLAYKNKALALHQWSAHKLLI